eukprot:g19242.t1
MHASKSRDGRRLFLGFAILEIASEPACDNFELVRLAVESAPLSLQFASSRLRADSEIVMTAVVGDARAFAYASETLQDDSAFVVAALEKWASLSKEARKDYFRRDFDRKTFGREESWMDILLESKNAPPCCMHWRPNVQQDLLGRRPDLCRRAAAACPWMYVSKSPNRQDSVFQECDLLKDPSFFRIVLQAACLELAALVVPPSEGYCRHFTNFVRAAADSQGPWVAEPDFTLLLLTAVTLETGPGLESDLFSDAFVLDAFRRADREVVLFSVGCCGHLLEHAGGDLQRDIEVVTAAIDATASAIYYASPELQRHPDLLRCAARSITRASYRYDLSAGEEYDAHYAWPPPRRDEAVEKLFASYMEECHGWSKEAVLEFLPDYPYLFFLLPTEELREDEDILRRVLELDDDNFIFDLLPENHKMHQDKEVVTQAVKRHPGSLLALDRSSPFWTDEDVLAVFREGCPNPMDTFVHYPAVVELTRI